MMDPNEIRELRKKLGLTQQGFAVRLGVAISTVQVWEAGKFSPSPMAVVVLRKVQAEAESAEEKETR